MASLLFWAVLGALAGAFAKLVLWDDRSETWLAMMLLSIGGALGGGFLRVGLGSADVPGAVPHGFDGFSMLLALLGAAVLLKAYHFVVERRSAVQVQKRHMAA